MKSNWKATRRVRNNIVSSSWKSLESVRIRLQHVCTVWGAGGPSEATGAFVRSSVLVLDRGSLSVRLECKLNRWQSISQAGSYTNCRSAHRYTTTRTSTQKSHVYLISTFLLFLSALIHSFTFCLPDGFNLWPRGPAVPRSTCPHTKCHTPWHIESIWRLGAGEGRMSYL